LTRLAVTPSPLHEPSRESLQAPRTLGRSHRLPPEPPNQPPNQSDPPQKPFRNRRKLAGRPALILLLVAATVAGSLAGLTLVYSADLPQIHDLERFRPSTTTDLYDRKGRLIGSFALEHRVVVNYDDFAPVLRQAVVSIEDKNFESHGGINVFRIGGALWHDLTSHGRAQGASTLTQQLARNLFLSSERTMGRKVQEAYLAIQIERSFTKEQIFTLYGNQIYLGSGQYGFEAAAEYYFSKHARDLSLPEAALLAGLPKGPVAYSPLLNPDKALKRRNLVLSEMESDGDITHEQAEAARQTPLGLRIAQPEGAVAPWFQEEVRRELEKQFGTDEVHEAGLRVDTTLDLDLQQTANRAVEDGLAAYERRHGWKGKLTNVLAQGETIEEYKHPDWAVQAHPGDYVHVVVTRALPLEIHARLGAGPAASEILLQPADWQWTGMRYADALVKPGDIIYVHLAAGADGKPGSGELRATLEEDSGAEGALLAIDNTSGDVLAMVGGRDYALSQFNRATQAERQTGSSFKPYVYTTAIEAGATPNDIIVDEPVSFNGWSPHNYENDYKGAMTLTAALADSRNIPAVKLAARVGMHKVIDMAHRFGVTANIPAYLPVALGAAEITLEEQVASYSVFPNDGVRVAPRLVRKVTNADGITLWEQPPAIQEVVSRQTARTMLSMLQAVTRYGTGAAASQLNHPVAGKTGTTSSYTDAWFLGFTPSITCGVWVGYDSREPLGDKETGAKAALPIWMMVMKQAIVGHEDEKFLADEPGETESRPAPKSATETAQARPIPSSAVTPVSAPAPTQTAAKPAAKLVPAQSAPAAPQTAAPKPAAPTGTKPLTAAAANPAKTGAPSQPKPTAKPTRPAAKAPPTVTPATANKLDSILN
jgi:penicillin-binding protein 1A